jgi:L-threonylcarbamoyladenylate synthase
MAVIGKDIFRAKSILEQGDLVGIPTETVYGLAGNALDPDAVAKIFAVKNRPNFDPLILHTYSLESIFDFVLEIPDTLLLLAEKFWPGPLTLLLSKRDIVPDLVTSGLDKVAVRVPNHPLTRELLSVLDFPLAAPSANPFGYISPTQARHVNDQLGDKIAYILDGGSCQVGLESTIVGMEDGKVIIYRLGGLEVGYIEKEVGEVQIMAHSSSNPKSPGMLKSHYAPKKPFVLGDLDALIKEYTLKKIPFAVLSFDRNFPGLQNSLQLCLSEKRDFSEAAKSLFAAMRTLDSLDVSVILAELIPEIGLGRAINDRLRRASAGDDEK